MINYYLLNLIRLNLVDNIKLFYIFSISAIELIFILPDIFFAMLVDLC